MVCVCPPVLGCIVSLCVLRYAPVNVCESTVYLVNEIIDERGEVPEVFGIRMALKPSIIRRKSGDILDFCCTHYME